MASTSETGHSKNVANFKQMITYCTGYGATYAPSNTKIIVTALNTKFTASDNKVKAVEPVKKPYKDAEAARFTAFSPLNNIVRAAFANLKSSDNVSATTINDANTLVKKITISILPLIFPVAIFIFLPAAARTRFISSYFGGNTHRF